MPAPTPWWRPTATSGDYASASNSVSFTISPAPLTVSIGSDSQTYGTPANLTNLTNLPASISTGVNNETLAVAYSSVGDTTTAGVGTYAITGQLSSGTGNPANYLVAVNSGILTVNPATLTITANSDSKTYGTLKTFSSTAFKETGLVTANGDTIAGVTETSTESTVSATVGSDNIVASAATGTGLSNYTIGYVNGTLTVNPAPLTITAVSQTTTYGASLPALSASYGGFVNGDTSASLTTLPTLATAATSSSPVGSYAITASGAVDANYTIAYVGGTLSVLPAPLTITAVSQSIVYGSYSGSSLPPLTASYSGFVNSDTSASLTTQPALTTTAAPNSPVGTYPITVSGAADGNYAIAYVAGTITVTPAP